MQSCIQPKLSVLLRKVLVSLNDKKKMDPLRDPAVVLANRPQHEYSEPPTHNERVNAERDQSLCRHAYVNTDDDEFISYAPGATVGKVGMWVSGLLLTPEDSYFEIEIVDCGVESKMFVGVCSWNHPMNTHIGRGPGSVGLSVESGMLFKDGDVGGDTLLVRPVHEYDCIGCGIRFDQILDPCSSKATDDTNRYSFIYFTLNGKEIGSVLTPVPPGGFHPAVSMQSPGEEVRVSLGIKRCPLSEDDQMVVDSNEDEWGRLYDIQQRGQILEYCGKGIGIADVGLAQARCPLNTTTHYFELEILDPGENCCIAIGLTRKDYPNCRHPGWNKGSIGYHADDGKIFVSSGRGDPFGPRCHKGDRMGCGIFFPPDYTSEGDSDCETGSPTSMLSLRNHHEVELIDLSVETSESEDDDWRNLHGRKRKHRPKIEVFFTRNGQTIGTRQMRIPTGGFYPSIGMMGINERVRVDLRPLTG